MNSKSLFGYLKNYLPSEGRDPKEDYLTQMFAWLLENVPEVASTYVCYLYTKMGETCKNLEKEKITVSTQEVIHIAANQSGRIDLVVWVGDGSAFICEHKVNSDLSENQIEKYMDNSSQLGFREYHSVLVTSSSSQWTQYADVRLTWGDIYSLFDEQLIKTGSFKENEVNCFLVQQFLEYLKENGMGGYTEIKPDIICSWYKASLLEVSLKRLFSELVNEKWDECCPSLHRAEFGAYKPVYNDIRWGRLGIDFHAKWPGVFAGVILNPSDHGLYPIDMENGPDFCIFVDSDYSKKDEEKRSQYEKIITHPYILERKRVLSEDSGVYEFLPGLDKSPWRILVLRRPLIEVLKGAYSKNEQYNAIKAEIITGINVLLG